MFKAGIRTCVCVYRESDLEIETMMATWRIAGPRPETLPPLHLSFVVDGSTDPENPSHSLLTTASAGPKLAACAAAAAISGVVESTAFRRLPSPSVMLPSDTARSAPSRSVRNATDVSSVASSSRSPRPART